MRRIPLTLGRQNIIIYNGTKQISLNLKSYKILENYSKIDINNIYIYIEIFDDFFEKYISC